jgi:putative ABC transport system permease protein
VAIVAIVFAAMIVGNAVLSASGAALYRTYSRLVAGDVSVSAVADSNFTVFGSDQLLVGEILVAPVITHYERVEALVSAYPEVRSHVGLVTGNASIRIDGVRHARPRTVFGVSFPQYRDFVGALDLVAGEYPGVGEPGIVVQTDWVPDDESVESLIGRSALLSSGTGRTFTLREVPVRGVFRYPVEDDLMQSVVLVDVATARALNGYVYGALEDASVSEETQSLLDSDVDDLFGDAGVGAATDDTGAVDLDALLGSPDETDDQTTEQARRSITGAWNFLLISTGTPADASAVMRRLESDGYTTDAGYRVRDWSRTVGGNASLVRYLQLMFNAGLVFVAIGAAIVSTNALMLSILERTGEIGTMRALGAGRERVAAMISIETVFVVLGAAIIGIGLGIGAVALLNDAAIVPDNRYLAILFGGAPVRGVVTPVLVVRHLAVALLLTFTALAYPLKRALGVHPREAMAA